MKVVYPYTKFGINRLFKDPVTEILRRHTFLRLGNFVLLQLSDFFKPNFAIGLPAYFNIETTNYYNLKCPFCSSGLGFGKREKGFMPFSLFKKVIDEISCLAYKVFLHNLGEPLLHKEIFDMIAYANQRKLSVSLVTNGMLFDEVKLKMLLECGCEDVTFAVDAATSDTYKKLRPGGDFFRLKENISCLLALRDKAGKAMPKVIINFIVTRDNETQMDEFVKLGNDLGVDVCSFSLLWKQELGDSEGEKDTQNLLPVLKREFNRYEKIHHMRHSCSWAWKKTIINWDGSVVPCCYDYNATEVMGNVREKNLKSIWNSKRFRLFRNRIKRNRESLFLCSRCPLM